MKALSWLPLLSFALQTLAVPTDNLQLPLGILPGGHFQVSEDPIGSVVTAEQINNAAQNLAEKVLEGKKHVEKWFDNGREWLRQNGLVCEHQES
jgi:hypothetical protein